MENKNEVSLTEKMELILGLDNRSGLSDFHRRYITTCSENCTGHDPNGILSEFAIDLINSVYYNFFVEGY